VYSAHKAGVVVLQLFTLAVTCFTKRQREKLMKPILKAGLSASGVMNTLPRKVVHGPQSRQGLGFNCLYTEQGIQHTARIQWFTQDERNMMGQLMIGNMQEMKLCLGLNGAVMDHSFEKLGHLVEKSFTEWTWVFLIGNGMRLADDIPDFEFFRTGDELLMQSFLRAG
jgi:hypothetical protein